MTHLEISVCLLKFLPSYPDISTSILGLFWTGLGEEEGSWEAPNQSPTTSKDGLSWSDPCENAAKIYRKKSKIQFWCYANVKSPKLNKKLKNKSLPIYLCAMFLSQPQRCQVVFSGFLRFFWDFSICNHLHLDDGQNQNPRSVNHEDWRHLVDCNGQSDPAKETSYQILLEDKIQKSPGIKPVEGGW